MNEPRSCPFCGEQKLKKTQGSTLVEFGCWNGNSYCWEGELSGYYCTSCERDFYLEPSLEEIHASCVCRRGECPDCGKASV